MGPWQVRLKLAFSVQHTVAAVQTQPNVTPVGHEQIWSHVLDLSRSSGTRNTMTLARNHPFQESLCKWISCCYVQVLLDIAAVPHLILCPLEGVISGMRTNGFYQCQGGKLCPSGERPQTYVETSDLIVSTNPMCEDASCIVYIRKTGKMSHSGRVEAGILHYRNPGYPHVIDRVSNALFFKLPQVPL